MSGVFQNIDPPPPHPLVRGEDTLAEWKGRWGVNILEDARHSSVLYIYTVSTVRVYLIKTVESPVGGGEGGEYGASQLQGTSSNFERRLQHLKFYKGFLKSSQHFFNEGF
jgi:hypothetical protein